VTRPALSVVVPSVNGLADLVGCLEALEQQRQDLSLEVLVVDRCGADVRASVASKFPEVRVLAAGPETSIPDLRAIAFDAATAPLVAVIEDHVIVPPGWASEIVNAQHANNAVVGGVIENAATERLVDWAAFLCEYSHCIPPLPSGPADWLPGNNVVYPRELLQAYRAELGGGKWENHLHDALRRAGVPLVRRSEISVGHKKHYTVGEYLAQRFLYARSYAGARVQGAARVRRFAYGVAAFALPPLLLYRTVARVLAKRRHRAELVRAIPLLCLFVTSWAAGEIAGYWTGSGDSLARVC
jgi:glycosyltransferase involved in cell wall biosynthesis